MNIVQLSTFETNGGAGVAANRLNEALRQQGINSTLLVGASTRQDKGRPAGNHFAVHRSGDLRSDGPVVRLANNRLSDVMAYARFAAGRLFFLPHERDLSVRYQFSPAAFGTDLTYHPLIQQADVLHLHWINFGFLSISGLKSLFRLGKPVVWTLHDMWPFTGGCHYSHGCLHYQTHCHQCPYLRQPADRDLSYRVFEQKIKAFANAPLTIVTPSAWLGDLSEQSTLGKPFPTRVIPNTLDTVRFQPRSRAAVRQQWELPVDKPLLLFGSFNTTDPRKGFRYFVEALELLKTQQPALDLEVLVFGSGYDGAPLPYPVRRLGVLTTEEQVAAAYNAADGLVVPSLEDNLPNIIVESLACGTPVVAFRTGGIPEMIEPGQTGYLADTESASQLAEGLHWLLTHPDPEGIRQHARQFAEAHYSEVAVTRQHLDLYEHVVSEQANH